MHNALQLLEALRDELAVLRAVGVLGVVEPLLGEARRAFKAEKAAERLQCGPPCFPHWIDDDSKHAALPE